MMVAVNVTGMIALQNAFHRGRGIIVMPLSSALSNLVPIFGGIVAFGERLPEGTPAAAMRVGAFALTIASGALLSATRKRSSTRSRNLSPLPLSETERGDQIAANPVPLPVSGRG